MPTRPATHRPLKRLTVTYQPTETQRASSHKRGYNYKWQKARATYLSRNPLCVECKANGITKPATDVDHIIPHKGDSQLFWDSDNWQALCHSHHSIKTRREEGGAG